MGEELCVLGGCGRALRVFDSSEEMEWLEQDKMFGKCSGAFVSNPL